MEEKSPKQTNQTVLDIFLQNLSEEQRELSSRFFDLVMGRVLKIKFLSLDEKGKKDMETIFDADSAKEKEEFIKNNISSLKATFEAESKKLGAEIEKQILE